MDSVDVVGRLEVGGAMAGPSRARGMRFGEVRDAAQAARDYMSAIDGGLVLPPPWIAGMGPAAAGDESSSASSSSAWPSSSAETMAWAAAEGAAVAAVAGGSGGGKTRVVRGMKVEIVTVQGAPHAQFRLEGKKALSHVPLAHFDKALECPPLELGSDELQDRVSKQLEVDAAAYELAKREKRPRSAFLFFKTARLRQLSIPVKEGSALAAFEWATLPDVRARWAAFGAAYHAAHRVRFPGVVWATSRAKQQLEIEKKIKDGCLLPGKSWEDLCAPGKKRKRAERDEEAEGDEGDEEGEQEETVMQELGRVRNRAGKARKEMVAGEGVHVEMEVVAQMEMETQTWSGSDSNSNSNSNSGEQARGGAKRQRRTTEAEVSGDKQRQEARGNGSTGSRASDGTSPTVSAPLDTPPLQAPNPQAAPFLPHQPPPWSAQAAIPVTVPVPFPVAANSWPLLRPSSSSSSADSNPNPPGPGAQINQEGTSSPKPIMTAEERAACDMFDAYIQQQQAEAELAANNAAIEWLYEYGRRVQA